MGQWVFDQGPVILVAYSKPISPIRICLVEFLEVCHGRHLRGASRRTSQSCIVSANNACVLEGLAELLPGQ